mgnify:CR=1 FL=1
MQWQTKNKKETIETVKCVAEQIGVNLENIVDMSKIKTKDIKKLFNDYGFDYENVCRIYADGIKSLNFDETKEFLEYLNDNSILKDVDKNGKILGLLLTKSNLNKFRDVNDILMKKQ